MKVILDFLTTPAQISLRSVYSKVYIGYGNRLQCHIGECKLFKTDGLKPHSQVLPMRAVLRPSPSLEMGVTVTLYSVSESRGCRSRVFFGLGTRTWTTADLSHILQHMQRAPPPQSGLWVQ